MTRYSASRGILYSAPPGPDGSRGRDDPASEAADQRTTKTDGEAEPAARDATADD